MRTAVILAGGKGSRLNFAEKALVELHGKPILNHIIETLSGCVDEIIVVVRDEEQQRKLHLSGVTIVRDEVRDFGPVAGICSGLSASSSQYAFVAACDMPFIKADVVDFLFHRAMGYDVAIPYPPEPLHAVYRRETTIRAAKVAIQRRKGAIMYVVGQLQVNYVPKDEIRLIDPSLCTFVNINSLEDVEILNKKKLCD
ncbi:MAG: molybdenum cofactor guanylyltransferase [Halobacteriota archaeon]|jgi:molybdopterin-guanine dinucleotide biosynthesis protein A